MIDNIDPNLLKNGEIYDFDLAMNSYCFPVEDLITNNFEDFITKKINGEFINLRKYYCKQEFQEVRNLSHKLKSVFQMIGAIRLYKCLEQIQKAIDNKEYNYLKQYYLTLKKEMNIFIKELQKFTNTINYPISESLIETYDQLMKECDYNESNCKLSDIKTADTKNNDKSDENKILYSENGNVEVEKPINQSCCVNNCYIL